MSLIPAVTIREATAQDTSLILQFIRKKAAFDGVPHWVEATEERLSAELFGPSPMCQGPLAEFARSECGPSFGWERRDHLPLAALKASGFRAGGLVFGLQRGDLGLIELANAGCPFVLRVGSLGHGGGGRGLGLHGLQGLPIFDVNSPVVIGISASWSGAACKRAAG